MYQNNSTTAAINFTDSANSEMVCPYVMEDIPSESERAEMRAALNWVSDGKGGFVLMIDPIVVDEIPSKEEKKNFTQLDVSNPDCPTNMVTSITNDHTNSRTSTTSANISDSTIISSSTIVEQKEKQNHQIGLISKPGLEMLGNPAITDNADYIAKQQRAISLKQAAEVSLLMKNAKQNEAETKQTAEETMDDLNPYQCMKKLTKMLYIKNVDGGLYVFTGTVYELLTSNKISQLIVQHLRCDVTKAGSPGFVSAVRCWIYIEPDLVFSTKNTANLVAFKNTYLDLTTNATMQPNPNVFLTSYVNLEYDENASEFTPTFDNFLSYVCGNNPELIARIWEMIGYLLTPDMNGKVFFVLQGVSNSGKSVLGRFIMSFFDNKSISSLDLFSLGDKFALYNIVGKRINASLDLPSGKLNNQAVSNLKQLTGGDTLQAEAKYENSFRFENTCKFIFATNHALRTSEPDVAFDERCVVIPFKYSIAKQNQDFNLLEKFEREKTGIVKKALRAYLNLKKNNYVFSGEQYVCPYSDNGIALIDDLSSVRMFVESECEFTSNDEGSFTFELFDRYHTSCRTKNIPAISNAVNFSEILKKVCGGKITHAKWRDKNKAEGPQNGYKGIVLKKQ